MFKDYYHILGIPRNASKEQIKKAYYRKVKLYHPDRNPAADATEKFMMIQEAYDNLIAGKAGVVGSPRKKNKKEDIKGTPQYYEKQYKKKYNKRTSARHRDQNFVRSKTGQKVVLYFPVAALLFVMLLYIDAKLPTVHKSEIIRDKNVRVSPIKITTDNHQFFLKSRVDYFFKPETPIELEVSPIFSIVVYATITINSSRMPHRIDNSIFGVLRIFPIAMMLFSLYGLFNIFTGKQNEYLIVLIFLLWLFTLWMMYS